MKRKRNDDLKMMFMAFAGGYVLAKTGVLDDPALRKAIAKGIQLWVDEQNEKRSS